MQSQIKEEPNVEETLAQAKRVLSTHRSWLRKKTATVSPIGIIGKMEYDFESHLATEFPSNSTPKQQKSSIRVKTTSPPQDDDWDEHIVLSKEKEYEKGTVIENADINNSTSPPLYPSDNQRTRKKRRKSKGTVVPVNYTPITNTNAWEQNSLEIPSLFESDIVNREIRLKETLADIQATSHGGASNTDSESGGDETRHSPPLPQKQLLSVSSATIISVKETLTTNNDRQPQAEIDPPVQLRKKSLASDTLSFVTPATTTTNTTMGINAPPSSSSSSSLVVVKPGTVTKKLARNKIQPIHVVQPVKPVLPIKVHHSIPHQSSTSEQGDIVLEDAEDWIPPEEVLQLKQKKEESKKEKQDDDDMKVSDAISHHVIQLPIKRQNDKKGSSLINDESGTTKVEAPFPPNTMSLFSPKSSKKQNKKLNIEDIDSELPPSLKSQETRDHPSNQSNTTHSITSHGVSLNNKQSSVSSSCSSDDDNDTSILPCKSSSVRKPQPRDLLPPLSVDDEDKVMGKEEQTENNKERERNENQVPLLRVKSVSSIYTPGQFIKTVCGLNMYMYMYSMHRHTLYIT